MKKLLTIALLAAALTLTLVACGGDDTETGTESVSESASESESTSESESESESESVSESVSETDSETESVSETDSETESESQSETETETETETEAETLPECPGVGTATQVKPSWDTIYKNTEGELAQADGGAAEKFTATPFKLDDTWHTLMVRGWAGSGDTENRIEKFGYRIDLGEIVVDNAAYREAEDGVIAAGGDARYCISIPTEALKGGFHYVRAYGICADGTAVEILNMWIEGRDLTAIEAAQIWDADKSVVTHLSFDELRDGASGIFPAGAAANWDGIAKLNDTITTLQFWGWVGIKADTVGLFGYSIDGAAPIFDAAWSVTAAQDVIDAASGTGAATASRMLIDIPVAGLIGDHTVTVYYKAADDSAACILKEFTVSGPAILDTIEGGLHNNKLQIDAENSDNYSASISGWMGFDEFTPAAIGWAVDGGAITWDGSINTECEDAIKDPANAGEFGFRYTLKASLTGLPYGDHEVVYYAKLPSGDLCQLYTQNVTNKDPSVVENSTANFDTAENADLLSFFANDGGAPGACNYADNTTPYKLTGITSIHKTMDGTYQMSVKNLVCGNAGQAVVFFRGNPNPNFGDGGYFGHDGTGTESVGCAGIYVSIIDVEGVSTLRINVKGQDAEGKAVPHIYTVALTGKDFKVVDDNTALTFYEGDKLLATVAISGMNEGGYATQAVVTIGETVETLDDVCCAATAASDIGFIARGTDTTFEAVTVKGLDA